MMTTSTLVFLLVTCVLLQAFFVADRKSVV